MFEEIGRSIDRMPMIVVKFFKRFVSNLEGYPLWTIIMLNVWLFGGTTWVILTSLAVGWWLLLGILPVGLSVPYVIVLVRKIRQKKLITALVERIKSCHAK
jgi:uncharacterized protein (DUF58 family)